MLIQFPVEKVLALLQVAGTCRPSPKHSMNHVVVAQKVRHAWEEGTANFYNGAV